MNSRTCRSVDTAAVALEAVHNARANGLVSCIRVLVAVALGFCFMFLDVRDVRGLEQRFVAQVDGGRFAWTVAAPTGIPASACDGLQTFTGVKAAGGEVTSLPVRISTQRAATYPLRSVTPGYLTVLWPDAQIGAGEGLIAGSSVAESLGLRSGSFVTIDSVNGTVRTVQVSAVLPSSKRNGEADRSLFLVTSPSGTVQNCSVDAEPGSSDEVGRLLRSWFGPGVSVSVYAPDSQGVDRPERDFLNRSAQYVWLAAVVLVVLSNCYYWYLKRGDYALYRVLGLARPRLLLMSTVESGLLIWMPFAGGMLLGLLTVGAPSALVSQIALLDAGRATLVLLLMPLLDVAIRGRGDIATQLKGR